MAVQNWVIIDSHPSNFRPVGALRLGTRPLVYAAVLSSVALSAGCSRSDSSNFSPTDPARGPSDLVTLSEPQATSSFAGGNDPLPAARDLLVATPLPGAELDAGVLSAPSEGNATCDADCRNYCASLELENPVNIGLCERLWGIGLGTQPIIEEEACRRLYMDTLGRFPTLSEAQADCVGQPWGAVVARLLESDEFVALGRRSWADTFRYDTTAVNVERIFDADALVGSLYQGRLAYDQFAATISAHPVITRRFATEGDRAEALFQIFLGRPPFGSERTDVARLYHLWESGYYDHPNLQLRLPDAVVRYRCIDEQGNVDPNTAGECTSILYGFEQLVLKPDLRAQRDDQGLSMWSGLLTSEEWKALQAPGRLISGQRLFWEHAASQVLLKYLGYDLGREVPAVTEQLVRYVLNYEGDVRALHFAVLTSAAYRQSATGGQEASVRWTFGPLKQVEAEGWVDSIARMTGLELSSCDWRINRPEEFLEVGNPNAFRLVQESDWELSQDGEGVSRSYTDLVRTLGGCPDNSSGGRFKIISVLTTVNQLNFVGRACNPSLDGRIEGVPIETLLPSGITARQAVSPELGASIVTHQVRTFLGREPSPEELTRASSAATECALAACSAEDFARPTCFALLSSAEMLFY